MSPEERAKAIVDHMFEELGIGMTDPAWFEVHDVIAQAIRDAEDAVLERAAAEVLTARRAMSCFVNTDDCQQFNLGVVAAETAVLNLKSKEI